MRVCALYSGGKDSNYALHWAFLHGFQVECLVTLKPAREDSWMFHYPGIELTRLQAEALGLPQIMVETSGEKEKELEDLRKALRLARDRYGVEGVVAGALLSDYQRMRISLVAESLGLRSYTPLWRKDQASYMRWLVEDGFSFMLLSVSAMGLDPSLLGKPLDAHDVERIISLAEKYGFNPALEGGEAETLVVDAPLFSKRIEVEGDVVKRGPHEWVYMVRSARLRGKSPADANR